MLGAIDETLLLRLLEAVADEDAATAIGIADDMRARSLSFDAALADLAGVLLRAALVQCAPGSVGPDAPERERIEALASRFDPETVQLLYQIALQGREDLPQAPDAHGGFLMSVLRMLAFRPDDASGAGATRASDARPIAQRTTGASASAAAVGGGGSGDWNELVGKLSVTGAARQLARNAELRSQADGLYELVVPKSLAHLAEKMYVDKLKSALEQHLGRSVRLQVTAGEAAGRSVAAREASDREVRQQEAERAVHGDRFVQDLVTLFDGKVLGSSIKAGPKSDA